MQEIKDDYYDGERPLYGIHDTKLINTTFGKGESPLKETANLALDGVFCSLGSIHSGTLIRLR